jgi:hypothetical protein
LLLEQSASVVAEHSHLTVEVVDGEAIPVSHLLENRGQAWDLLRRLDVKGQPRRGNHLAADLAGAKGRAFVMRVLVVFTVLLLILGVVPLPAAYAETPDKGQALGILFLAGLLRTGSQPPSRPAVAKPKLGALKVQGRAADVKTGKPTAKDSPGRFDQTARAPH